MAMMCNSVPFMKSVLVSSVMVGSVGFASATDLKVKLPSGQLMSTSARLPDARIACWIARGAVGR